MKTKLATLIVTALAAASGYGAVYNVTTGTGATSSGIAPTGRISDPAAAPISGAFTGLQSAGIVAFGIFTSTDAELTAATSLTSLVNAFAIFGGSGTFNAPGATGQQGVFGRSTSATVAGSAFDTKNIYAFVGNGTTFANSTELAIIKSQTMFAAAQDQLPTAQTVTLTMATTSLIWGVKLENLKTTTADVSVTPAWGMAMAVPETSTALLGALGVLGLLRRRR
jgi:hypothetical protein